MTAIAVGFDNVINNKDNKSTLESISDGITLLANSSLSLDIFRRKSLRAELKDEFASLCNDSYPVQGMLFGDNIGEKIKEVNESNRVAKSARRYNPYFRPKPKFPFLSQNPLSDRGEGGETGDPATSVIRSPAR